MADCFAWIGELGLGSDNDPGQSVDRLYDFVGRQFASCFGPRTHPGKGMKGHQAEANAQVAIDSNARVTASGITKLKYYN